MIIKKKKGTRRDISRCSPSAVNTVLLCFSRWNFSFFRLFFRFRALSSFSSVPLLTSSCFGRRQRIWSPRACGSVREACKRTTGPCVALLAASRRTARPLAPRAGSTHRHTRKNKNTHTQKKQKQKQSKAKQSKAKQQKQKNKKKQKNKNKTRTNKTHHNKAIQNKN
jgi:hypothetical protein